MSPARTDIISLTKFICFITKPFFCLFKVLRISFTAFIELPTTKINFMGIIYISHKMAEIKRISDEITIMRDGQWIATRPAASWRSTTSSA